jgi:hypothetical protein
MVINPTILNLQNPYHCEEIEIVTTLFVEKNNPFKNIILSDYYELVKLNFYS